MTHSRPPRPWWLPPRQPTEAHVGRSVSFLELFYDLVYVVLVAELAHTLALHPTVPDTLKFIFLFTVAWWAWFNGTAYHDLHGNNDLRTRIFVFMQMFAVGGMATFAHNAIGDGSTGYGLSYAAFQGILAYLWWRTGVYDQAHSVLSNAYALTFLLSGALFALSVLLPKPLRYWLWGAGLLISLILPGLQFSRRQKAVQTQVEALLHTSPALVERFGLIMILVLAEVIAGAVRGVSAADTVTPGMLGLGFLGMLLAALLWWLYFDFVSHRPPRPERGAVLIYFTASLLGTMAATATGALVLTTITQASTAPDHAVTPLLSIFVGVLVLSTAAAMWSLNVQEKLRPAYQRASQWTLLAAGVIFLTTALHVPAASLLIILLLIVAVPISYGIHLWINVFGAVDMHTHGALDEAEQRHG